MSREEFGSKIKICYSFSRILINSGRESVKNEPEIVFFFIWVSFLFYFKIQEALCLRTFKDMRQAIKNAGKIQLFAIFKNELNLSKNHKIINITRLKL